ncbi:MAG: TauD/TfdA family dioxygenase [Spirochaetaceae bacterium]|nr:TauD/TfdA family dioxygenase [Myxococcales bacterium]MCB9725673.1 TauD/TfdA family dioxygenase [Spirochaetaceae bacterium]
MTLEIEATGQACGARIRGVDLTRPLAAELVAGIRAAWLEHHVLVFPDQPIDDDDLERVTRYFGPFGDDPFLAPIAGRRHVAAIRRDADETTPIFAEAWHTDWSFQATPPAGTCLRSVVLPPRGGDTLFANQHAALDAMPADLRARLEGLQAIHSARLPYAPTGAYGDADQARGRSMDIRPSEAALAEQRHPLLRAHPETGRPGIFGAIGYIVGLEGLDDADAIPLLKELLAWQTRDAFVYRHVWEPDMLVMWDNRSVLHAATGGYEGHARLLHRTTIGER